MPNPLMVLAIAIYGTWRLIRSARSGVFETRFGSFERADQPTRFGFNMVLLGRAVAVGWMLALGSVASWAAPGGFTLHLNL